LCLVRRTLVPQPILGTLLSLLLMMPSDDAWAEAAASAQASTTAGATTLAATSSSTFNPEQLDARLARAIF
jgi:hypothetical protein